MLVPVRCFPKKQDTLGYGQTRVGRHVQYSSDIRNRTILNIHSDKDE
jgi:predicted RNA binding protein YcfA (HicA-like mRNA interferase family)